MEIYEIRAILERSNPRIMRQFTVPESCTIWQLHGILQLLIGVDRMGKRKQV